MNTKEKIIEHMKALLTEGQSVMKSCGWDGKNYQRHPVDTDYQRLLTQSLNITRRACGENSDHYLQLKRIAETKGSDTKSYYLKDCLGVLEAAQKDFEVGFLFDLKSLVAAELLGDFIDQADFLLKGGYFHPAASLAGAVLEDVMRKLCHKHGIPVPDRTVIDRLNAELAKVDVYDKLVQKRITALADIRNNADHGHFDKFKSEDVEDMIKWVRRFSADYLH